MGRYVHENMLSLGLRAAWELLSELASRHNSVLLPLQQVKSSYLSSSLQGLILGVMQTLGLP